MGGTSVSTFTMIEFVLPCCCTDFRSVPDSVDDVDSYFRKLFENQSMVYTRAT